MGTYTFCFISLYSLYAQRETADDILVVRNGYLTDTSISNIALYDGNTWFTPSCPLLKGTKRAELLDKHLIQEKEILHTQLGSYFRIMLFNAMIDWGQIVIPIRTFISIINSIGHNQMQRRYLSHLIGRIRNFFHFFSIYNPDRGWTDL